MATSRKRKVSSDSTPNEEYYTGDAGIPNATATVSTITTNYNPVDRSYQAVLVVQFSIGSTVLPVVDHWVCTMEGWENIAGYVQQNFLDYLILRCKYYSAATLLKGFSLLSAKLEGGYLVGDPDNEYDYPLIQHRTLTVSTDNPTEGIGILLNDHHALEAKDVDGLGNEIYTGDTFYPYSDNRDITLSI